MSREILFRGKRVDNGEWVDGLPYKAKYGGISSIVDNDEERFLVIPETFGQYTGLTDKNGKRIFEGDIVKHYNRVSLGNPKAFDIGLIFWCEEKCMLLRTSLNNHRRASLYNHLCDDVELSFVEDYPQIWKETARYYEVIGNIHDNPELLTAAGADQKA